MNSKQEAEVKSVSITLYGNLKLSQMASINLQ